MTNKRLDNLVQYWLWMWEFEERWLELISDFPGGAVPNYIGRERFDAINAMLDLEDPAPYRKFWLEESEKAEEFYQDTGDRERLLNVQRWRKKIMSKEDAA